MSIISVPKTDPIKATFISEAESILAKAVDSGDFDSGFRVINELHEHAEVSVQIIGAGLDMLEGAWDKFSHEEGDSFLDAAIRNTRLNSVTIRNQINVHRLLSSDIVPKNLLGEIAELGQKSLIRIANTVSRGYEVEDDDWLSFAESVNERSVDVIARKIEGKEPRSNFVGLYYKKSGELLAFVDGELVELGSISMSKDPKVTKAREVLIARSGMLDKVSY